MNQTKRSIIQHTAQAERMTFTELLEGRNDQSALARYGKVALYRGLRRPLINYLGKHLCEGDRLSFIGTGWENLVFSSASSDEVIKLLISSIGSSAQEAQQIQIGRQDLFEKAKAHMGDHLLQTAHYPIALPKAIGSWAVVAVQPRVEPLQVFADPAELSAYADTVDHRTQLGSFIAGLHKLGRQTDVYPDLFGPGNIMAVRNENAGERLVMIDTVPETPEQLRLPSRGGPHSRRQILEGIVASWEASLSSTRPAESRAAAGR